MKKIKNVRKILVVTLSNLGDIILTTPVISALRWKFPQSEITVVVGPKGAELFSGCKAVNSVILYDKHASLFWKLKFILRLFRKRFDLAVDLRHTAIPFLIFPRYRTPLRANHSVFPMRQRHLNHIKELVSNDSLQNRFDFFSEEDAKRADSKLRRYSNEFDALRWIVIAPGAGSGLKRWGTQKFAWLAQYFAQKDKIVVLVGSEKEIGTQITQIAHQRVFNLMGEFSIREAAAIVSQSELVVSNDSAVMHLAHELSRPVVGIFGPTSDKKYGPSGPNARVVRKPLECAPCENAECQIERRVCLDDLQVEEVIRACEELFQLETNQSS